MTARPVLALSLGDPAGIGPEIAWHLAARGGLPARLLLIGDPAVLERERERRPLAALPPAVDGPEALAAADLAVALYRPAQRLARLPAYGAIDATAGAACHAWVLQGADLCLAGRADALVTGPIHKAAWHAAGIPSPGHTEALRDRAGARRVLMLLIGKRLRAALATIHIPLREVPARLDAANLEADLLLLAREIAVHFGPARPRIAVCGLNPHAGEEGLFGEEEATILAPVVAAVRARGLDVHGPLPADACIPAAAGGAYDAVFAMYHDQALVAVKSIAPRSAVNVTLGLPFVRTSVDHGTAFDIAGRGRATAGSLRVAIETAVAMIERKRAAGVDSSGSADASALNPTRPPSDLS